MVPELDDLSQRRSQLSAAKRALLEKWTLNKPTVAETVRTPAIPRRPKQSLVPLTFAQQRLWFLEQIVPGSPAYTIHESMRLSGILHVTALEASLHEIIRRHEALRTTFISLEGQPVQIIAPPQRISLPVIDLELLEEVARNSAVQHLTTAEAQRPFDLSHGPLMRIALLRLSSAEHILLLTLHHIISDGWSMGIFLRELTILYAAYAAGKPSPLPDLPIQYADFACWQREQFQEDGLENQLAYWQRQLAGAPALLDLPTDRPRPAIQSFQGARLTFMLPSTLTDEIKVLSRREGVTLFMVLLTAFQILLFRYTHQDDIVTGTPIANRTFAEVEGLIGLFANTLALRTDLSGNPSFRTLLQRIRAIALEAYAHQELPFEQLVDALELERDLSRNPFFQVMFVLQNAPLQGPQLPGLSFDLLKVENETTKFDLWLSMTEGQHGLGGSIEYNTDLFDMTTIKRLLGHFQVLLEGIVTHPEQRISDLALLTTTEQRQLLRTWNTTGKDYPLEQCLHQLIEAQVERTPDAIALTFEDQQLTYQELNRQANRLAHYLQTLGCGPEVVVAVCIERSLELVIALLGTLKAGGAYLPLDPTYPLKRLLFMLEDSRAALLITQEPLQGQFSRITTICLDVNNPSIAKQQSTNPESGVSPENIAYVIYTSGSTGLPKGAMNIHQGICNRLLWMQDAYQLNTGDRVLQKTPFSFDVSVWEFFWPLLAGAQLVIARPQGHRDGAYLVNLIAEQHITTAHFVPSMLQVFLEEPELARCSSLKRVICSGEALPFELQERFLTSLHAALYNLYGPTEAAIDVTCWSCERISHRRHVPIGRPIANIQIYILDQFLHPVAVGVAGELYIGGIGLARGYLHRPELMAERFIPDPFSTIAGMRLYKTGDRVRYQSDGTIEYLGRFDDQVKLRGFRIELGEIEATIAEHPLVRECVAQIREDTPGHKQLVAYVVPQASFSAQQTLIGDEGLPAEHVAHWQSVFYTTYREPSQHADPTYNIVGWNSSYTGLPIPAEEMQEWVDATVRNIRSCYPDRVLEIGCGTGLLLFRIAPHCASYVATDFSEEAITYLQRQLARREQLLSKVTLLSRPAHDFSGLPTESFDTIILNSVVQYFPSVDYLLQVIEGALQLVKPRGAIFIGDVRSLLLLEAFHTTVELHRASSTLSIEQLRQRVQKRIAQESELVLDPDLFFSLREHFPRICRVELQLKRGRYHNELTRFRYDVILHIGEAKEAPAITPPLLSWQQENLTLSHLRRLLLETAPEHLYITDIPNARLQTAMEALRQLSCSNPSESVGTLRQALQEYLPETGVEPEELWALSEEFPYTISLRWSDASPDGCLDAMLWRHSAESEPEVNFPRVCTKEPDNPPSWQQYANAPLREKLARKLSMHLQSYLKERLPGYMLPAAFVMLDALPLLSNGKLDRQGLVAPLPFIADREGEVTAPRTPVEETLAAIWADALGLEQVGIHNNFFELGGDSIRSILIIAKAHRAGLQLTPKQIFQYQTIAELAQVVSTLPVQTEQQVTPPPFSLVQLESQQLEQLVGPGVQIEDCYPLGPLQERMLFRYLSAPVPGLYSMQRIAVVQGNLNVEAFKQGWQQVIDRHPLLRTSFTWEQLDRPLQIVHKEATLSLEQYDWRALSASEQEVRLEEYVQTVRLYGLELARPNVMRLMAARIADDTYQLVVSNRYISIDGWSFTTLNSEAFIFYDALCQGKEQPHLELGRPYRDYIGWLQQQDLSQAEIFWRQELKDFTPSQPLVERMASSFIRQKPDNTGFARRYLCLSEATTQGLRSLSRQYHLTPNTFVQGAWALLLSGYSGKQEITFGASVSGRSVDLPGVESITGVLMNILPTRIQISAEQALLSWLTRLQDQQVQLRQYEYTPLQKIYEWCQIPKDQLLFESYLVFQNLYGLGATASLRQLSSLRTLRALKTPQLFVAQQEYPLRLDAFPGIELELVISYYQRFFTASIIATMLERLRTLLDSIVANPRQQLKDLLKLTITS